MNISVLNPNTDNSKLWNDMRKYYSHKEVDSENNISIDLKNTFEEDTANHIECMDENSIMLSLIDPFGKNFYATIVKTKIQGKEVILATKNIEGWIFNDCNDPLPKEMASFYRALFHHFCEL